MAAWFFSPKGENQVYVLFPSSHCLPHRARRGGMRNPPSADKTCSEPSLWRSSLILSIVSCYLMWAITLLSQLHPLIEPKRSDLRKEYINH